MRPLILAITVSQNEEIVSRLLDSGEDGEEETDDFADFYGFLAQKGVELAKAYQPKLRDGIKVVVEMVNSVAKDEQDGDVDMKVEIAPNTENQTVQISHGESSEERPILKTEHMKLYMKIRHTKVNGEQRASPMLNLMLKECVLKITMQKMNLVFIGIQELRMVELMPLLLQEENFFISIMR